MCRNAFWKNFANMGAPAHGQCDLLRLQTLFATSSCLLPAANLFGMRAILLPAPPHPDSKQARPSSTWAKRKQVQTYKHEFQGNLTCPQLPNACLISMCTFHSIFIFVRRALLFSVNWTEIDFLEGNRLADRASDRPSVRPPDCPSVITPSQPGINTFFPKPPQLHKHSMENVINYMKLT